MKNSMINKVTLILAAVALLAVAAAPLGAQTWKGSGLPDDPFLIESVEQLAELAEESKKLQIDRTFINFRGVHFLLTTDLDLAEWNATHPKGWNPIGDKVSGGVSSFAGHFDGGGHVIKNLYIDADQEDTGLQGRGNNQGLFGCTRNATIENLGLIDVDVTGDMHVGGLVGWSISSCNITNCYVTGKVSGFQAAGGLVGDLREKSIVSNCFSACDVFQLPEVLRSATTGPKGVLVGLIMYGSVISNCYTTGNIQADDYATGGIGGAISNDGNVYNCYAEVSVVSESSAAGILGYDPSINGYITNCVVLGDITGVPEYTNPIVGCWENKYKPLLNNYVSDNTQMNGTNGIFSNRNEASGESVSVDKLRYADFYTSPTNWSLVDAGGNDGPTVWNLTAESSGTIWNIWEGKSLPYFQYQSAPANLTFVTAEAIAGEYRTDDYNYPESIFVSVNGTHSGEAIFDEAGNWFYSFPAPLTAGDVVAVSVKEWDKAISYPVRATIPLDGFTPTSPGGTAIRTPLATAAEGYAVRLYSLTGALVMAPVSGNVYIRKSVHPTLPARVEKIIWR
jgi:hypothetical protein